MPMAFIKSSFDPLVRLLLLAIVLASVLPVRGAAHDVAQYVSNAAIFVLFLLNGLRLPRGEVLHGVRHWRLLLPLALWCFGAMALAGFGLWKLTEGTLQATVALGFLYLGTLPSTVQSATAYSSIAGGNVAVSVVAAALLNVLGVFVSAPLFALLGGGEAVSLGYDGLIKIATILLLPFALGQLLQNRVGHLVRDHKTLATWMDRTSIAIAVYVAFSAAVDQGIWGLIDLSDWLALAGAVVAFILFGFGGAWLLASLLRLARKDSIAMMFSGGQKSIAMGAPLAAILFPPAQAGLILLPVLSYHLLQLIVSAPLANRLARPLR
jgi:solute carrier family 10 (sodium/bile acid cotransporter), member 7